MEIQGTWTRDREGFMEFETAQLQRLYEDLTDKYHQVYNRYVDAFDDDEAYYKALEEGYEMVTDDKIIDGVSEFATTYKTPAYVVDVWYEKDEFTGKRVYDRGWIRISSR